MVEVEVVVMGEAVEGGELDPQVEQRQNRLEAACLEAPGTLALEVVEVVEELVSEGRRASGPSTES